MRKMTMLAVLAATVAAGCGGGGSSSGINNFVGAWVYTGGTITQACAGSAPEVMNLLNYNVSIARTGSELSYETEFDLYMCERFLTVRGSTATMTSATPCGDRQFDQDGFPYTLSIVPQTENLTYLGGGAMRESASNALTYTYDDGLVVSCTSTITNATLSL